MSQTTDIITSLCRKVDEKHTPAVVKVKDLRPVMDEYLALCIRDFSGKNRKAHTMDFIRATIEAYRQHRRMAVGPPLPGVWTLKVGAVCGSPRRGESSAAIILYFRVNPDCVTMLDDNEVVDLAGMVLDKEIR